MCDQAVKELLVAGSGRGCLAHHHDIDSVERLFVLPKGFANDSFQPISLNCQPAVLFRYRQSKPGALPAAFPRQNREQLVPAPTRFFENALKGSGVEQTILSCKPLARRVFLIMLVVCRNGERLSATARAARVLLRGGASG